ncbi:MAG: hypothetical protein RLZZ344_889 [Pseudomonadota bacterium]|jgi:SNF family Na+-dependent transporter
MQHASTHLFIFFGIIVLLPFLYPIYLVRSRGVDGGIASRNTKVFAVVFGVLVVLTIALTLIKNSLS